MAGRQGCRILDGAGNIDKVDAETGCFTRQIGDDASKAT